MWNLKHIMRKNNFWSNICRLLIELHTGVIRDDKISDLYKRKDSDKA